LDSGRGRCRSRAEDGRKIRELVAVDLAEISPVLFPANDNTELLSVRRGDTDDVECGVATWDLLALAAGAPLLSARARDLAYFDRCLAGLQYPPIPVIDAMRRDVGAPAAGGGARWRVNIPRTRGNRLRLVARARHSLSRRLPLSNRRACRRYRPG